MHSFKKTSYVLHLPGYSILGRNCVSPFDQKIVGICQCIYSTFKSDHETTAVWIGFLKNKLAKARKMRKPPGTFGLKKFGPGKI